MSTVLELRASAKKKGIKGYSTMKKAELEKILGLSPRAKSQKTEKSKSKSKSKSKKPTMSSKKSKKESQWMVIEYSREDDNFIIGSFDTRSEAIACALSKYQEFFPLSIKKAENIIYELIFDGRFGTRDFGIQVEQWTKKKQKVHVAPQLWELIQKMIDEHS